MLHARISALSEGHLAVVIFCVVLGDPLLFYWEELFLFLFPPFSFFFGFFVLLVREIPVLRGGLIFLLVLYFT